MVRGSEILSKTGISKTLVEIMVCPLSKQPLRFCQKSNSLISDAIGVSYPIVDGIPHLVPHDGKMIDSDTATVPNDSVDSSDSKKDS
ncbi:hypothetical protein DCAR_0313118 [Daucus carota subsp. sativus]|uniref:Protein preY, mitochondrial n=1 Tax=Daucus carota subsp. sativus TaxID=79200 RepID=A0A166BTL7_DAUCS|nr:PREDICTED: protein preY, mitochondrial isoform X2 [Daucus carota subsp. sativus]WOG93831.1 hypothetical protein DCAR_0313118 [Daucus carota subsp. sativus]